MQTVSTPFWLSRSEVRDLDRRAIEEFGVSSLILMENAGRGVAELLRSLHDQKMPVIICCGRGNNGGDGFVIARHLENAAIPVEVWLFADANNEAEAKKTLSPDAFVNYQILLKEEFPIRVFPIDGDRLADELFCESLNQAARELKKSWVVDALFGTGASRPITGRYAEVVTAINANAQFVMTVDIPSGLDCDSGRPLGPTIRATHTATFVARKRGFLEPEAAPWIGEVHVMDIGVPKKLIDQFRSQRPEE